MDAEAKKILTGLWADAGDRTDPDDPSLTPVLSRATGWGSTFSADSGDTPRRRVVNQRFRELDGVAADGMKQGVRFWDADIDYERHATTNRNGRLYQALVANGPATSNATDPLTAGQVVWNSIAGKQTNPSAPNAPIAVVDNGTLRWTWNCPLDGGSVITAFLFRWRRSGQVAWSAEISLTHPAYDLTGLTNGTAYEAQVKARTSVGDSLFSATGTGTPIAGRPGKVFGLHGLAGDTEVELLWNVPDDGGSPITGYQVEWREDGQAFSSARRAVPTANTHTVTGLTNGTLYYFRARAVTTVDEGDWSDVSTATPVAATVPTSTAARSGHRTGPGPGGSHRHAVFGLTILWEWQIPDDGGPRITDFRPAMAHPGPSLVGQRGARHVELLPAVGASRPTPPMRPGCGASTRRAPAPDWSTTGSVGHYASRRASEVKHHGKSDTFSTGRGTADKRNDAYIESW